ncbi:alpha/beta hydrolase fold protein [Arthrobacter crystallopoietes BAB-32]|uniref:Alpha/beta hydrolase fold protein n=1 Tax=Arthrobacter crystallopoietes BAB-32 TaxID=1246476 RepID=N1UPT6_9MICC|nr:alpha/beta hydrolase [Arthrobacter crystallopoietes]EMY32401.1 alpha/beta hydrolase fold protein [Arthrobacter crystallopoietes BAB-32]
MAQRDLACQELNRSGAETVLFLHGGNVAGWMWEPQHDAVRHFHCLIPDLPGYGGSSGVAWESMGATADLLADFIRTNARGGRAHIVGLSLGAVVGLHLAGRHPSLVTSGFLTGAPLTTPGPATALLSWFQMRAWDQPWFWKTAGRGYGLSGPDLDVFVQTALGISKENRERIFGEVYGTFPVEVLRRVSSPVLYVTGSKDMKLVKDSAGIAAREVPDIRTATAPGMHHQWNIEDIGLFNRALEAWLTGRTVHPDLAPGVVSSPDCR